MKIIKKLIPIILLLIVLFVSYNILNSKLRPNKNYSNINLSSAKKLMIVAHPDDEVLWGGAHLLEDDYLVVCATCGRSRKRAIEFIRAMKTTNDQYIMLGYPDKTHGQRDNWNSCYDDVTNDLKKIIELKDWDTIVTHNPDGEYGHIHHKMLSKITTDILDNKEKLYYFGEYFIKKNTAEKTSKISPIDDRYINEKKKLISIYISQSFIQKSFNHIYNYEDWKSYEEWMSEHEK